MEFKPLTAEAYLPSTQKCLSKTSLCLSYQSNFKILIILPLRNVTKLSHCKNWIFLNSALKTFHSQKVKVLIFSTTLYTLPTSIVCGYKISQVKPTKFHLQNNCVIYTKPEVTVGHWANKWNKQNSKPR